MPVLTLRSKVALLFEARRVLGLNQEELGELLLVSKRTVARKEGGRSSIDAAELFKMAAHVHPIDPSLAEELALAGGATLQSLGLAPNALPPTPSLALLPGRALVDAVVCAAADSLKVVPDTVREALLAAFSRARELRMTIEDVEAALTKPVVPPEPAPSREPPGDATSRPSPRRRS